MRRYKVGKGENYEDYVLETLRVMWDANIAYFTLPELASWAGLPQSISLRRVCDALVLRGWLGVAPREVFWENRARTYKLDGLVWMK